MYISFLSSHSTALIIVCMVD